MKQAYGERTEEANRQAIEQDDKDVLPFANGYESPRACHPGMMPTIYLMICSVRC